MLLCIFLTGKSSFFFLVSLSMFPFTPLKLTNLTSFKILNYYNLLTSTLRASFLSTHLLSPSCFIAREGVFIVWVWRYHFYLDEAAVSTPVAITDARC